MTLRGPRVAVSGITLALALFLAGCPKQHSTLTKPPELNPPPPVERSAGVRIDALGDLSKQFAKTAEQLPGRSADEHRRLAQQAFADLAQILPTLFGPDPTGTQRQQLRVVENARSQLASAPKTLAPEPTIDTGLRAARDALSALGRGGYYDSPDLAKTLDQLDKTVSDLDAARGTSHQQVVAETVELMSQAVGQMSDALRQRLEGDPAATQPAENK